MRDILWVIALWLW